MNAHLNNETEAEADTPEQVLVEDDIKEAGPPRPVTTSPESSGSRTPIFQAFFVMENVEGHGNGDIPHFPR